MNTTTTLHQLWQLAMALLLSITPLFNLLAQTAGAKEKKVISMKIKRDHNGQEISLLDTTLIVPGNMKISEAVNNMMQDPKMAARMKDLKLHFQADSAKVRALKGLETLKAGDTVHGESPASITIHGFGIKSDSVKALSIKSAGVEALRSIRPEDIESIRVVKLTGKVKLDSLLTQHTEALKLKVTTDEKTGERKMTIIDENENEVISSLLPATAGERASLLIINRKAKIEDMTADDKEALKEAGAAVETRKRNELDVEEIGFYPNPSNGRFNLNFSLGDKGTTRVSVMDSRGEEVFVDTVEGLSGQYNRQLDLTPFGPGIYYLQIAQGRKYHTKKILVQ